METPKTVLDLIERFNDHHDRYRSPEYNEAQVRREFIDPLFEALGWDVQNKKGYAEPYKEVVHEDSIKVGGVTKAPDYSFRIGGRRLFFLEAKKPAVNLKEDPSAAYQLRRYAWTAKLPVSILTDFEEFIVYDTRVKPEQNDKASTARVLYIPYTEYADRWGEIAALFSPQAIQKGALDRYVESKSRKRGTAEVDDAFLAEIEEWRDLLARNIALRNPGLKQRELNFAVQLTIDRIIFLRICEDRGIENFAQLQALLNGTDIYARLRYHFERADERYNSGLFHFHKERDRAGTPDTLTPKLNIDDKVLKAIIRRLYYPESPYEFSVFPAEILGHVYERFLGSVIRLSAGGRATVEQKPEVRKAGGVYYTPTYIVEYIVKHTVGNLLGGLGDGGWGVGRAAEGRRGIGDQELSGSRDVAGGDESGGNVLSSDRVAPVRGEIRVNLADPAGSRVSACKHSRGLRPDASRGLHTPPVDRKGVPGGSRDLIDPNGPAEPADARRSAPSMGANSDRSPSPHAPATKPQSQETTPQTPPPKPQFLTPQEVAGCTESWRPAKGKRPLAILDPACGSGSFLLGAYQYLLDWHLQYYSQDASKWSKGKEPRIFQYHRGGWRLTTMERKRILLANIYGVDIDTQAVEVTKLSLLLKVLEGENSDSLQQQLSLLHQRALPDLANNIKCGNSLIGPDFYQGQQLDAFDEEEQYRINAFDWNAEFAAIMKSGGFDAVIGNPPYIRMQTMKEWAPLEVEFYKARYDSAASGNFDIYVVFIERGLSLLSKCGHLGFICPHKFFNAKYGRGIREVVSKGRHLESVVHFGDQQVFTGATTYTCLLFLTKLPVEEYEFIAATDLLRFRAGYIAQAVKTSSSQISGDVWNAYAEGNATLNKKLEQGSTTLDKVCSRIFQGLVTGCDPVFVLELVGNNRLHSRALDCEVSLERRLLHPLCKGSLSIRRYFIGPIDRVILFPYSLEHGKARLIEESRFRKEYPKTWKYLNENRSLLEARERGKWKHSRWYAFGRSQNLSEMEQRKILTPSIAASASYALDELGQYYFLGSGGGGGGGYGLVLKDDCEWDYRYILGVLNSSALNAYLKSISSTFRGGYFAWSRQYLEKLPIHFVSLSDAKSKARHDKMVSLVQRMLDLHKRLQDAKTGHERTLLERQIAATDEEIDRLVYELYGLTDDEIAIVEESSG